MESSSGNEELGRTEGSNPLEDYSLYLLKSYAFLRIGIPVLSVSMTL
jgi:hypothetical protein